MLLYIKSLFRANTWKGKSRCILTATCWYIRGGTRARKAVASWSRPLPARIDTRRNPCLRTAQHAWSNFRTKHVIHPGMWWRMFYLLQPPPQRESCPLNLCSASFWPRNRPAQAMLRSPAHNPPVRVCMRVCMCVRVCVRVCAFVCMRALWIHGSKRLYLRAQFPGLQVLELAQCQPAR